MKFIKSLAVILCFVLLLSHPANAQNSAGFIDVHMHLSGDSNQSGSGRPPGPMRKMGPGNRPGRPFPGGKPGAGSGSSLVRDYGAPAEALIAMMDDLGIAKAVIMPPPQRSTEQLGAYTYKDLLPAIKKYPGRLVLGAGGGSLSPMIIGNAPDAITDALRQEFERKALKLIEDGTKVFGEMAALHFSFNQRHGFSQVPADHPLFLLLADIAAKNDIPIDLHMEAVPKDQNLPAKLVGVSPNNPSTIKAALPGFESLLTHNRKARIVWQHVGWDNTGHMNVDLLRRLLTTHSNLYMALKVVAKDKESFRYTDNDILDDAGKVRSEWLTLFKEFPDRFVIGADEFVGTAGKPRRTGPPSLNETWSLIKQLPKNLQTKIGRENAARIYHL